MTSNNGKYLPISETVYLSNISIISKYVYSFFSGGGVREGCEGGI
jgi:hypothetical protein